MKAQSGQIKAIKEHLESGKSLTSMEAFELYGCTRLSAQIFYLKSMGMHILTDRAEVPTRFKRTAHVAVYYLDRNELK